MNVAAATTSVTTERWVSGGSRRCVPSAVTATTSAEAASNRRARRPQNDGEREPPRLRQLAEDQPGDQVAGDDEEHVDPDESAVQAEQPGVVHHHGDDGERPQALDVGPEPLIQVPAQRPADRVGPAAGRRRGACSPHPDAGPPTARRDATSGGRGHSGDAPVAGRERHPSVGLEVTAAPSPSGDGTYCDAPLPPRDAGDYWRAQPWGWVMFTIHGTPNRSAHMPNSSPHICFSSGTDTVPPADNCSQ